MAAVNVCVEASKAILDEYEAALGKLARFSRRNEAGLELPSVVREVLVSEIRFMRGDVDMDVDLSADGILVDPFAACMVERLMLDSERSADFLRLLTSDIRDLLAAGGSFEGTWGTVKVRGEDLVGHLTAREKVDFEKSTKTVLKLDL